MKVIRFPFINTHDSSSCRGARACFSNSFCFPALSLFDCLCFPALPLFGDQQYVGVRPAGHPHHLSLLLPLLLQPSAVSHKQALVDAENCCLTKLSLILVTPPGCSIFADLLRNSLQFLLDLFSPHQSLKLEPRKILCLFWHLMHHSP